MKLIGQIESICTPIVHAANKSKDIKSRGNSCNNRLMNPKHSQTTSNVV